MLTRHLDTYSDTELEDWVRHLVDDQVAESARLDYKESGSLDLNKSAWPSLISHDDRLRAGLDVPASDLYNELS
jgi:hypothetical protein